MGDAFGTTLEFSARDSRPHRTEITGGGPFGLEPGQWTDDTSMALALADSLLACGRLKPFDVAERFARWWREGAYSATGTGFDIGAATARALGRFERVREPLAGSTDEAEAGNGSLMRLAPVMLAALSAAARMAADAVRQSRVTHGAPQVV